MTNVIVPNYQLTSNADSFQTIWKLTRAIKKAGWTYKSSSNGFQKDTTGTTTNDMWGPNADPAQDVYTNISTTVNGVQALPTATLTVASTASFPSNGGTIQVATTANGWQTITYTGTTATTFTGCTGGTGSAPNGANVGSAGLTFSGVAAWWNAQGPSTLKIPFAVGQTAGSDGYFIRGENLTQSITGAQGELLGYLYDGYSTGYIVVAPRVDGSGADPHGWDHTHIITGGISGATVTPNATVIEFVREVVFWKTAASQLQGATYYQCVDGYSESTSRFSTLALNANATVSVAPGGSASVGNQFPAAGSFVVHGDRKSVV